MQRNLEANMVALLKDDGEFTPMPVVFDTAKFEQLQAECSKPAKPVASLVALIRKDREAFRFSEK
jgi:hypothetical protein